MQAGRLHHKNSRAQPVFCSHQLNNATTALSTTVGFALEGAGAQPRTDNGAPRRGVAGVRNAFRTRSEDKDPLLPRLPDLGFSRRRGRNDKENEVAADRDYQLETQERDGAVSVALRGRVTVNNAQELLNEIAASLPTGGRDLSLDLSEVEYFDSGGGAVIIRLRQQVEAGGGHLHIASSTPDIDGFLEPDRPGGAAAAAGAAAGAPGLVQQVGDGGPAGRRRGARARRLHRRDDDRPGRGSAAAAPHALARHLAYMERAGVEGLPIVALISFLMGLITAFQAAVQLTQFGADIYIANLVGLSIVRELGPLMTAIIAAGRSGAAFAAEIGTMKVAEEVDALAAMGLDRTRFLVTPKVVALVTMLPCLTLFADLVRHPRRNGGGRRRPRSAGAGLPAADAHLDDHLGRLLRV